ncbi:MAG: hypothetical protein BGO09_09120 [Bacteroidetes bacterium 47-18]|nr:MAG: hypothetical protein BGO09_09120 [Bacteroidetes bacterium 47-18]
MKEKSLFENEFEQRIFQFDDEEKIKHFTDQWHEHERKKKEYERLYFQQVNSYAAHRQKFGNVKAPERPYEYKLGLDRKLIREMDDSLQEIAQQRQQSATPSANDNRTAKEMTREQKKQAFLEQIKQIREDNEKFKARGRER